MFGVVIVNIHCAQMHFFEILFQVLQTIKKKHSSSSTISLKQYVSSFDCITIEVNHTKLFLFFMWF